MPVEQFLYLPCEFMSTRTRISRRNWVVEARDSGRGRETERPALRKGRGEGDR
jgi:hypothetical protein